MERDDRDWCDWLGEIEWDWAWPCHRHGHIWLVGDPRCAVCDLPYELRA